MKIIACLGNPGKKYAKNRHNIGFIIGHLLKQDYSNQDYQSKFKSKIAKAKLRDEEVLFLFPETFMNNSGEAVISAMNFYKINSDDLVVIHDELELSFGDIRLKEGGGHKGHNGIRSIINNIGTADFKRIRFGVGRPPHPQMTVADYVLSDFSKDEFIQIPDLLKKTENLLINAL